MDAPVGGHEVRAALIRQWQAIASAIPTLDLDRSSRVVGWRNREVLAHLYVQPVLVCRFLATASPPERRPGVATNLSGTGQFSDIIDASAKDGATKSKFDLAVPLARAVPELAAADLRVTITTWQGPIALVDYLVTRCVEAVVHGGDLVEPVPADTAAQAITAWALMQVLATSAPNLVTSASRLSEAEWIAAAAGRTTMAGELGSVLPVMT
jgi:hypothetical protein